MGNIQVINEVVGEVIFHVSSKDVLVIEKINKKTYSAKSLRNHRYARYVRVNKCDCISLEQIVFH